MYGWTKEEVVNRPLMEFIKTEYLTEINTEAALQELTESGHWQGEVIQNRKDGSLFTILASVSMARDAEGRPVSFIAINRDLTERKIAEENLLQFRQIMDETNDAIFLIDAETCKYVDFNKSARTMLGYSNEELSQLGPMDVAREIASFPQWLEWVKVIREKGGWLYETVYQRRDKTDFPVEVSSKLISPAGKVIVAVIVRDITERRYAEETLQKSEELYRLLAENSSDAVSLINADGKVLYVSPSYYKILGFPSEDYFDIGLPEILERIHPEDRERILLEIMRGNELKLASSIYSYRAKTKQGGYVWVEDVLRREFDENGLLIRTIVNGRDITERKRMEEALIQSKNQAQKNNILLQSIMESPQGIVIFALDVNFCYIAFTVTHKNTMKTIWGVDIEIGMNMLDAITEPLDREKAKRISNACSTGNRCSWSRSMATRKNIAPLRRPLQPHTK
ncbi:MAG: PAS domain S-box protein [Anaerolineales bacterium]|nr:PAS domain S-box protein [Anaerolineales bacterium]